LAFTVVYDADVLHPASLRDLLVRLATTNLFRARWTDATLDEMVKSVLDKNPDLSAGQLDRTRALMVKAVPDCMVTGFEPLIPSIELPDPDDRHVVAAAVRCNAGVIVTSNVRDFPDDALAPFNIEAQSPDIFVLHLLELEPGTVVSTIARQAAGLRRPPQTYEQLLDRLGTVGLSRSVALMRSQGRSQRWLKNLPNL